MMEMMDFVMIMMMKFLIFLMRWMIIIPLLIELYSLACFNDGDAEYTFLMVMIIMMVEICMIMMLKMMTKIMMMTITSMS